MRNELAAVARRHLDDRINQKAILETLQRPSRGWVRAIREALGMTTVQLAQRIGVTQPAVVLLERSEALGRIRLDTLQRAADALNCRLVYALIPNQPLETLVESRRQEIAAHQFAAVRHSMALEDQSVTDPEVQQRLLSAMASKIDARALWNEF